jgi:hypothetical protein
MDETGVGILREMEDEELILTRADGKIALNIGTGYQ